jgi:multidrug efflux system membrane fusion protein
LILAFLGGGYLTYSRLRTVQSRPVKAAGRKGERGSAPIPVVAAKAHKGSISVFLTGLGSVTPIYTVTLKSRVDGQLMKVLYKEGDLVHQGDLLAEIDARPYQVQLEQAEAQLAKDQAALENSRLDLKRYQTLLPLNAIPEQQVATQKALVLQNDAAIKTDQAQVDTVKLNINYCHIVAPITGRIGLRLVDPGNMVHAADAGGAADHNADTTHQRHLHDLRGSGSRRRQEIAPGDFAEGRRL